MTKDKMKKWVQALKSGKYKQGRGSLYNEKQNTYCCLGVARAEGLCLSLGSNEFVSENFLPQEAQEFLSKRNDNKKSYQWSFKKIAKYIQKNFNKLNKMDCRS